jgi:DNA-binding CsgD family transcriptional regulator
MLAGPDLRLGGARVSYEISDYERSIVQLIASNLTDERAAAELHVSVRTFRRHLRLLMDRVGARNRCALGAIAASGGWITPPAPLPQQRLPWPARDQPKGSSATRSTVEPNGIR